MDSQSLLWLSFLSKRQSKGHAQNAATFRLVLTCDQCRTHVETDVPLHNIRDQGDAATEPYLERARLKLALVCHCVQA